MAGYRLMLAEGKIPAALGVPGLLVIFGSVLLSVFLFAKAKDVQDASSKRRLQPPDEMPEAAATSKLLHESRLQEIPSVTERTTEYCLRKRKATVKETDLARDAERLTCCAVEAVAGDASLRD